MLCALLGNSNSTDVSFLKRWEEQREDAKLQPCAAVVRSAEGAIIIRLFFEKKSHRTFEGWLRTRTEKNSKAIKKGGPRLTFDVYLLVPSHVFPSEFFRTKRGFPDSLQTYGRRKVNMQNKLFVLNLHLERRINSKRHSNFRLINPLDLILLFVEVVIRCLTKKASEGSSAFFESFLNFILTFVIVFSTTQFRLRSYFDEDKSVRFVFGDYS